MESLKSAALCRILSVSILIAVFSSSTVFALGDDSRPLLFSNFSGSTYDPGWLFKLDTAAGYKVNRHFEITAGIPVYFLHMSEQNLEDGFESKAGIGNFYIDLRVMGEWDQFYFSSSLRGAAPTGDASEGFSSGRATVDWNNYFEYDSGMWTPFVSAGIANSISDTHFFTRPFTSLGIVGQFEGGLLFHPSWWVSLGGSGYAVIPTGQQKIYSRLYASGIQSGSQSQEGSEDARRKRRAFEESFYTVSDADILEDHGLSGWVDVYFSPDIALEIGYSRSISYEYNTVFFAVRFDLAGLLSGEEN